MKNFRLSPPLQLALVFLLFGIVWILITDILVLNLSANSLRFLSRFQTYKGMLFMSIAAVVIYFVSRSIFKRQRMLQEKLSEQKRFHQNELAREVLSAQENERKKFGEELHDNINQMLGVVKLYIEHAQMNPDAKNEMLRKSSEYIKQVINEIRALSRSLISPTLKDLGLVESIHDLVQNIQETKMIRLELKLDDFCEQGLSETKKLLIYRILQEQLNNILRHSYADYVLVELRLRPPNVFLRVEDDGKGFDVQQSQPGLGLKNIRHRLELFGGKMKVVSAPGQGCRLETVFEI